MRCAGVEHLPPLGRAQVLRALHLADTPSVGSEPEFPRTVQVMRCGWLFGRLLRRRLAACVCVGGLEMGIDELLDGVLV